MKNRMIAVLTGALLLAVPALADEVVKVKPTKRVVLIGDGDVHFKSDAKWNVEGIKRGYMGISMVSLTDDLRNYFGVADGLGVLISEVQPDSPAAKAGLKGGDVIVSVDGKPIDGPSALGDYVREKKGGDQVKIDVRRKGTAQQFFVTLDERDVRRFEVRVPETGRWIERNDDGNMEIIELDEGHNEALDRMRVFFESPEFETRVEKLRGDCGEYQERLQDLEKKMKELEQRLEKLK